MKNMTCLILFCTVLQFSYGDVYREKKCSVFTRIARAGTNLGSTTRALSWSVDTDQARYASKKLRQYVTAGNLGKATDIMKEYFARGGRLQMGTFQSDEITPALAHLLKAIPDVPTSTAAAFLADPSLSEKDKNNLCRWLAMHLRYGGNSIFSKSNVTIPQLLEHYALLAPLENPLSQKQKELFVALSGLQPSAPPGANLSASRQRVTEALAEFEAVVNKGSRQFDKDYIASSKKLIESMMELSYLTIRSQRLGVNDNKISENADFLTASAEKTEALLLKSASSSYPSVINPRLFKQNSIDNDYWNLLHHWRFKRPQEEWEKQPGSK